MFLLLLLIALSGMLLYELPRLVKDNMWGELAVFILLWSVASFLSISFVAGLKLPNPTDLITTVFNW